jgi:hypothetical protein
MINILNPLWLALIKRGGKICKIVIIYLQKYINYWSWILNHVFKIWKKEIGGMWFKTSSKKIWLIEMSNDSKQRSFIEVSLNFIPANFIDGFENIKVMTHLNSFTSNQFVC